MGGVNRAVGFKAHGVVLWGGSPLVRSQLETTIAGGCKQTGQTPKEGNKGNRRSRKLTLKSEGNGDRRLREDLADIPTVLRGIIALRRQFSMSTTSRTRDGELKCSTFR